MALTRLIQWLNGSDGNTPLSASRLNAAFQEVADYADGVLPTGSDQSTQIQALIDATSTAGGGTVRLGPGEFLVKGIQIKSNVHLKGAGVGATVLKLPDSANQDLITVASFGTLTGGTTQAGPLSWGISDMTLDGNKANNSSGWVMRVYGYRYVIDKVEFKNGKSGGVWSQWGTGGTDMEAKWSNFSIHDCDGPGLEWRGPHDSMFLNGTIFKNAGKGIHTNAPATSEQFTNVHIWGTEHTYGAHLETTAFFNNCQIEGATTANFVPDVNFGSFIGGHIFGTSSASDVLIQLGLNSTARYWRIITLISHLASGGKGVNYVSSSANNLDIDVDSSAGAVQVAYGTPSTRDSLRAFNGADPSIVTNDPVSGGGMMMGQQRIFSDDNTRAIIFGADPSNIFIDLLESSNVNNAVTNGARIAARDNGSGKTQLVVRFQSGAVQVLATEP